MSLHMIHTSYGYTRVLLPRVLHTSHIIGIVVEEEDRLPLVDSPSGSYSGSIFHSLSSGRYWKLFVGLVDIKDKVTMWGRL